MKRYLLILLLVILTVGCSDGKQSFVLTDSILITAYIATDTAYEDVVYYMTEDKDVKALYEELSDMDFSSGSLLFKKPVIYLYPEKETDVTLKLQPQGKIIRSYPVYEEGWHVHAEPSGRLTTESGHQYAYLYWEGMFKNIPQMETSYLVKSDETADFLEEKLTVLGLNYRERNDFITYWLPELEENPYNQICFLTEAYDEIVPLQVSPTPDTVIRILMVYQGRQEEIETTPQTLTPIQRTGFTVVEWGGVELK